MAELISETNVQFFWKTFCQKIFEQGVKMAVF